MLHIVNTLVLYLMIKNFKFKKIFLDNSKSTMITSIFLGMLLYGCSYKFINSPDEFKLLNFWIGVLLLTSFFSLLPKQIKIIYYFSIILVWLTAGVFIIKMENFELVIILNLALILLLKTVINTKERKNIILIFIFSFLIFSLFGFFSTYIKEQKFIYLITILFFIFYLGEFFLNYKQKERRLASSKRLKNLLEKILVEKKNVLKIKSSQSNFLATFSHDLRQPMHALNLYVGSFEKTLLKTNMEKKDEIRSTESLRRLKQSINYMNDILSGLLEASRIEMGVSTVKVNSLYVNKFCRDIIEQHRKNIEEINLKLNFNTNLTDKHILKTDKRLLERILRNLLSNAIKYTKKGGIRFRIKQKNNVCKISIVDTGPGISKSIRKKIFKEFLQGPSSNQFNGGRGVGLGLSIAQRLASRIGATITLRSQEEIGSIFSVLLPPAEITSKLFIGKNIESDLLTEVLPQITLTESSSNIIFLIDEDPQTREAITGLGPHLDIKIISNKSSKEILKSSKNLSSAPKLLIIDFDNKNEDPFYSIDVINEEFNLDLPTILICSDPYEESLNFQLRKNIIPIQKPFVVPDLQKLIFSILLKQKP